VTAGDAGRPRVLVMHPLLDPGPRILAAATDAVSYPEGAPLTEEAIREAAAGCRGIVSQVMDPIGELVLSTPGLRAVANVAVGYDNVDVAAATRHGVLVTNTPGILDETTADLAFALLMAAARRVVEGDRQVRDGRWKSWAIDHLLGQDVHGAVLGVVGMGRIGRAVAGRGRGFGMRIVYSNRSRLPAEREAELDATWLPLPELLREADFVSLHVPLGPETRHLIGAAELAAMKPTAVLVNTARGPVVDEAALVGALREGRIFAAGLDVYEREPQVHPGLIELENVVLAPHIGSGSVRTRARMCEVAAENMVAAVTGRRPPNVVNPDVLQEVLD
jgi:glyoxylate reductase